MSIGDKVTNDQKYNLVYLMEEAGEVVQACSKILRFGPDTKRKNKDQTNAELLEEELGDLVCIIQRLIDSGLISEKSIEKHGIKKLEKLAAWEEASFKADKQEG